jgi:hypothetical protein
MHNQMQEPVEVLRQRLSGERFVDEDVISSVVVLADRLERLKAISPMFEAVSFSPDVEALMKANLAMTVN